MSSVFIFHGIQGHPGENWFPWLKKRLEDAGNRVIVPAFPHADRPQLQEWLEHFHQYRNHLTEETVLIGHSLGGAFALRVLERLDHPVRAVFLIASVSGEMGNEFDPLMTSFTEDTFDWPAIRKHSRHFHVIHSDNDPYIDLSKAEALAEHLGTRVTLFRGAGHFNAKAGYTTFAPLYDSVMSELSR